MKPNLWEYILALIWAYPAASILCGGLLLLIAGLRLSYRKYILEDLKRSHQELQIVQQRLETFAPRIKQFFEAGYAKDRTKLAADDMLHAHLGTEYVADYNEERSLKSFIHSHNNWWKLKNLSITIGLSFVGLLLIIVPLVNDIVIKGNAERIWSLLGGLVGGLVVYFVVKEALSKFLQLEVFFTKMKNDIDELKEQNTKVIKAISDLNHRLHQLDFNKRI